MWYEYGIQTEIAGAEGHKGDVPCVGYYGIGEGTSGSGC